MDEHPARRRQPPAGALTALLLALLLLAVPVIRAAAQSADPLEAGRAALSLAVSRMFNGQASRAAALTLLDAAAAQFAALPDPAPREYWLARVEYFSGIVERAHGDPRAAERRFTASLSRLAASTASRETSDAYRLMADDYAQLMMVNGALYAAVTGWKVKGMCEKALALDRGNAKASLTLALYYMNAPGFAGGDLERAAEMLLALRARADLEDEDRFAVRVWLGAVYGKKKDRVNELASYGEAREVFPGSSRVMEMMAGKG
jgi:hypothetical protein